MTMQNNQNGNPTFPAELTAEMLAGFRTTPRGCTHPRVGEIGGHRFIAKCGSWSAYSSDEHVHNEFVADNLLRAAGLNVPFSREYRVDFEDGRGRQTIRLAVYDDALKPIMEVWESADATLRAKIRAQAVAAYPIQALIAGIDTFTRICKDVVLVISDDQNDRCAIAARRDLIDLGQSLRRTGDIDVLFLQVLGSRRQSAGFKYGVQLFFLHRLIGIPAAGIAFLNDFPEFHDFYH